MQLITIENKTVLFSDINLWQQFKAWVESTSLFQALMLHSGNPNAAIEGFNGGDFLRIDLTNKKLNSFEELPKEVLFQFFINSPFYITDNDDDVKLNQLLK